MRLIDNARILAAVALVCALGITSFARDRINRLLPITFYKGPVTLTRVTGTITLKSGQAPTTVLQVQVTNASDKQSTASIAFRGAKAQKLTLKSKETRVLKLAPVFSRSGDPKGTQGVRADLAILVDGEPMAAPPVATDLTIELPDGVPALIRASMPLRKQLVDGRTLYHLARRKAYLTQLHLVYSAGPVTLQLEKSIVPKAITAAGPVKVTLKIRNLGPREAVGVLLHDNYDPRDFAGKGKEFTLYRGKVNDRRLLWSHTIPKIRPGASTVVTYTLQASQAVHACTLNAATASLGGQLVGVSNKIVLPPRKARRGRPPANDRKRPQKGRKRQEGTEGKRRLKDVSRIRVGRGGGAG